MRDEGLGLKDSVSRLEAEAPGCRDSKRYTGFCGIFTFSLNRIWDSFVRLYLMVSIRHHTTTTTTTTTTTILASVSKQASKHEQKYIQRLDVF